MSTTGFKDGGGVASMVARRRRQHPPEFGRASTFVETTDLPLLETFSERFLRAIGYYGLVEVEYKLDRRDGRVDQDDEDGDFAAVQQGAAEVARRYEKLGGKMELKVAKGQGHNYWEGFFQCPELVDFVLARCASSKEPKKAPAPDKP